MARVELAKSAGMRWLVPGAALTIVCGVMTPVAMLDLGAADERARWPRIVGRIESAGVRRQTISSGRLGAGVIHVPDVRYRYEVAGVSYAGDVVSASKGDDDAASAAAAAARYPVGASVTVRYDPADPTRAVLAPQTTDKDRGAVWAMAAGLLLGLSCLWRFRVLRRRELAPAPPRRPSRGKAARLASRRRGAGR